MMIGMQGLGLWAFTAMAARFGPAGRHIPVFLLWIGIQASLLLLLGHWNLGAIERILPQGFELRRMWLELFHTGTYAGNLATSGWMSLVGAGLLASVGSALTGGLTGSWLIVHCTNYLVYFVTALLLDIMPLERSNWFEFSVASISHGQVVLITGLWLIHLGLTPWLWQRRQVPAVRWRLRKYLVGLGLGIGMAGYTLLLL